MKRIAVVATLAVAGCQWVPGTTANKVEVAKQLVREELVDGASAQFETVVYSPAKFGDPEMVCGWVNARNRMGGYVGAQRFLVAEGRVRSLGTREDEGYAGRFGACVASDKAASDRMMRDVDRAIGAYRDALT